MSFLTINICCVEMKLGKIVGRGCFAVVHEVRSIAMATSKTSQSMCVADKHLFRDNALHGHSQQGRFIGAKKGSARYVVKVLNAKIQESAQDYVTGIADMALEAKFLAVIRHPNIVKLIAMGAAGPFSIEQPFFLVLERLHDTLCARMIQWKKQIPRSARKLVDSGSQKVKKLWLDRLQVAHDLASALTYLHSINVLYRDLKPKNIGFAANGTYDGSKVLVVSWLTLNCCRRCQNLRLWLGKTTRSVSTR